MKSYDNTDELLASRFEVETPPTLAADIINSAKTRHQVSGDVDVGDVDAQVESGLRISWPQAILTAIGDWFAPIGSPRLALPAVFTFAVVAAITVNSIKPYGATSSEFSSANLDEATSQQIELWISDLELQELMLLQDDFAAL
ncbi:MAG: hypothetical protein AAF197_09610 [Pseudomonadota bacterium]